MEEQLAAMGLDEAPVVFSDPAWEQIELSQSQKVVTIKDCDKLKSVSLAEKMECLEKLEIHRCRALKKIKSSRDTNPLSLPTLKTLEITDCGLLENVFENPQLELSQLRRLVLKNLGGLTSFCSGEFSFGSQSQSLEVEACPQLSISQIIKRSKLKNLCLCNVGNQLYEHIIQLQGEYFLSNLEKLRLKEMYELKIIWKDPRQIATLQNLAHLEVFKCNQLKNIFSVVLARNLPQLSRLEVQECEELDQVVVQDRNSSAPTSARHKPVFFPNLEEICIRKCNKLKNLFPFKVVLPKLKKLEVKDASDLREIFGHDGEANKTDEKAKEKLLPELKILLLEYLPKFIGFSAVAYGFVFHALNTLKVTECGSMIKEFYFNDDPEDSYVQTELKQSKSGKEGNLDRPITLKRIEPRVVDQNIEWKRPGTQQVETSSGASTYQVR